MNTIFQDLRYGTRMLLKTPAITFIVVLALALGIGANTAIFSVLNAVVLRPLPYDKPNELLFLNERSPVLDEMSISYPNFTDWRNQNHVFEKIGVYNRNSYNLTGYGDAERILTAQCSADLFSALRANALVGRLFTNDEDQPGAAPVVVLSYALWQRRFGGQNGILNQPITLNAKSYTVIGVMPPDYAFPSRVEMWVPVGPLTEDPNWKERGNHPGLYAVARLKPGMTQAQAQADMNTIAANLNKQYPDSNAQNGIRIRTLDEIVVGQTVKDTLWILFGAVAFVLLIACANIANLLLVRASERGREIAVRAALGSGRARIVAQMLTESLVLAAAGTVLGLGLAWQGIRVIKALSPANLPRIESVSLDGRAFAFAALVAVVAAILFGLAPALRAVRGNLADGLRDRGTDTGGARGNKLRTVLVVSEVTLSLVLLIGAGLMVRSFAAIQRVNPGFDAKNVVTFNAPIPFLKYLTSQLRATFINQLGDRLAAIPGVQSVGGVTPLPLAGGEQYSVGSYGRVGEADDTYRTNKADYKAVLPGYFEAMRIPLVSGRTFLRSDNEDQAQDVAIVDAKFAARVFGKENPLGASILVDHFNEKTFSFERLPVNIVGVVANVRSTSLAAEGRETIYLPYVFQAFLPMTFVVRTTADPAGLLSRIRTEVSALDRDVPVADLSTLASWVTEAMSQTRFLLALSSTFAGLALVLAAIGLYGVVSFSARQRTREIGVRVALGASDRDVRRLIVGQGMLVAAIGIVLGLGASVALTRVVSSYLVGVSATDPVTFAGVPLVLLGVSALASYLPARRATAIDPVRALREE